MKHLQKIAVILLLPVVLFTIKSCKELTPPVVTTFNVSGVTQTSAISGGHVKDDGGAEVTVRGICWGTNQKPTIASSKTNVGTGIGSFISYLTDLAPNINYYVRAYATNSEGTSYGNEISFITSPIVLATISTTSITSATTSTAVCGGNITFDGGATVSERGVCWSTNQNPTTDNVKTLDGSGNGSFTTNIKCLSFATTYYVRAYATNSAGTAYGDQVSFTTKGTNPIIFNPELTYGSVTDIDGNCYKTIQIADRIWMAENLRTSRYNDGVSIPNVTDDIEWQNLEFDDFPIYEISGAYCWYNNDSAAYENLYGKLYNFGAVQTGKLCPIGWHVPDYIEIKIVESYPDCGSYIDIGWNLMEEGSTHWTMTNSECERNATGFTALPGGGRSENGLFNGIGITGKFWSSHPMDITFHAEFAEFNKIPHEKHFFILPELCRIPKEYGLSVRCVKDN